MKSYILSLFVFMLSASGWGYTQVNKVYYNLDYTTRTAEVTSGPSKYTGTVSIPSVVNHNGVDYDVTSIGSSAFSQCYDLTSITIGDNVTSIEESAFSNCAQIKSITIPNSVNNIGNDAFKYCNGLTSVTLGDNVVNIGSYAFSYCSSLTSIIIPNSVINIYEHAFEYCTHLSNIILGDEVKSITDFAFGHCEDLTSITIPNSVTNIGYRAFTGCSSLASVSIGKGVEAVDDYAFSGCTDLLEVTCLPIEPPTIRYSDTFEVYGSLYVPKGCVSAYMQADHWKNFNVQMIPTNIVASGTCGDNLTWTLDDEGLLKIEGTGPMYDYSKENDRTNVPWYDNKDLIVSVEISENVTHIGKYAFFACNNLETVTLPNSITSIGDYAFAGCVFSYIELPNSVKNIGTFAFNWCTKLVSIAIPNSVTSIGEYTFSMCQKLTTVTGGKGIISIGERAFSMDHTLTSVENLPVCTSIGDYAFGECGLANIDFLPSCTTIGEGAFCGCLALANVGDLPLCTSIVDNAFSDCEVLSSVGNLPACKSIGSEAFFNCTALRSIGDLSSCTSIGDFAFAECGLKTMDLSYCNNIGKEAFAYCKSLESLTLGNNIKQIGDMAFKKCSSLSTITSCIESPKDCSLGANVFEEVPVATCVLNVPYATMPLYQSTEQWKDFANIVEVSPYLYILNGLAYDYTDESQTAVRVKAIDKKMTDIVIPSEVYELPVVEIESEAFANCVNLVNVVIPSSIRTIGDNIFPGCGSLASIVWNPNMKLPVSAMNGVDNPNLLLYVAVKIHAPSNVKNVVVNGAAEEITLVDATGNNNFYVPQVFTAKHISYSHNYTQQTIIGSCAGWETIALPFDVQSITHSRNGIIAPFAANNTAAKPFWLYSLGEVGFTASSDIKANTPYIISMPNNDAYSDEYIQSGVVTFSAENVSVPKTEAKKSVKGNVEFIPTTLSLTKNSEVYAINKGEMYDGQLAGSVFVSNLRDVSPFEAYLTLSGSMAKASIDLMDLGFDDETAGITIPTKNDQTGNVGIYNVAGQRVNVDYRGIVIMNGKKMINK